jgi:hypothetical protein
MKEPAHMADKDWHLVQVMMGVGAALYALVDPIIRMSLALVLAIDESVGNAVKAATQLMRIVVPLVLGIVG